MSRALTSTDHCTFVLIPAVLLLMVPVPETVLWLPRRFGYGG
jgi:hypothetical protein